MKYVIILCLCMCYCNVDDEIEDFTREIEHGG